MCISIVPPGGLYTCATCGSYKKLTVSPYFLRPVGCASVYIIFWCDSDHSNLLCPCYLARIAQVSTVCDVL